MVVSLILSVVFYFAFGVNIFITLLFSAIASITTLFAIHIHLFRPIGSLSKLFGKLSDRDREIRDLTKLEIEKEIKENPILTSLFSKTMI